MKRISLLILLLLFLQAWGYSQTDTEFWFVAPDITSGHGAGGGYQGGEPILLRISTMNLASDVTITQPANPAFVPINITVPANSTYSEDLTTRIAMIENQETH